MQNQSLCLALAQINSSVGDLTANARKIIEFSHRAEVQGADLVIFPELAITGYPPEDLLLKSKFITDNRIALNQIKSGIKDIIAVVGFVDKKGKDIFNSAAVIYKGKVYGIYHKACLPNYGVFDEKRYFKSGEICTVYKIGNIRFGVLICEDIWDREPLETITKAGVSLAIVINASPYHMGKLASREKVLKKKAKDNRVFVGYVNLVGGQDELVFDGRSMLVDDRGRIISRAEAFKEDLVINEVILPQKRIGKRIRGIAIPHKIKTRDSLFKGVKARKISKAAEVYAALKLGLQDYVRKNHFKRVIIGLSGGIDSALTAAIAVDALGKENVAGVFMPSEFSSRESQEDAFRLAENLGIEFKTISIQEIFKIYKERLAPIFNKMPDDVTEENIQARIRGNILMAISNKLGWLVLTTGNKSEYSCGYATLYGDMAGGFAVIKDVPKTLIFELAKYRNRIAKGEFIPTRIITKEPSAELRPNQKDSDSLPPYPILDKIIAAYVEENASREEITRKMAAPDTVDKVIRLIDKSEYKRRQSPPGIKITARAFGKDRRMPITNCYKD